MPVYGRRRIGKTELLLQFIKNKPSIYFLATAGTKKENIERFKSSAGKMIDLSFVKDDWEAIFKYIKENIKERLVVVIDEFPYLLETEPGLSSKFQAIVDVYLKDSNIFLILSGSSLSMMYREVMSYRAPLYGRRTGQINLKQMSFRDAAELLKKPVEEVVRIYAVCGGVPAYLNEFRERKSFFALIKEKVLEKNSVLREEVPFMLREEFREPRVYMSILSAIALGYRKLGEIINYCGFGGKTGITPYLRNLEYLNYIEREIPVTETPRSKKGLYFISDNFMAFWFRFVRPNISLIEQDVDMALEKIREDFDSYLGLAFENVCKQFLRERARLPFKITKAGRWWHREKEIDIVALNERSREIAFFECKFSEIKERQARNVLEALEEKSRFVEWKAKKRYFGIIAKKVEGKENLRDEGFIAHDLRDFQVKPQQKFHKK